LGGDEVFEVEFYEDAGGGRPIESFLGSLDPKTRAKVSGALEVLGEKGTLLREPYTKHLREGIFELRVTFSSTHIRLLYFYCGEKAVVVTNGFVKKERKTPRREIALAKRRRTDYLRQRGHL
jgi:phage-related protein